MKGEFFISYGAGGGSRASHKREDDAQVAPHLLLYFHPSLTRRKSHRDARDPHDATSCNENPGLSG